MLASVHCVYWSNKHFSFLIFEFNCSLCKLAICFRHCRSLSRATASAGSTFGLVSVVLVISKIINSTESDRPGVLTVIGVVVTCGENNPEVIGAEFRCLYSPKQLL